MFNTNGGYSLSDIAAVTGNQGRSGGAFGEDGGAWWIIILFLFCFAGWGNGNGFGGNGGTNGAGYQGTTTREEIAYAFDMNGLADSTRGIQRGLCDGFYAMNTGMLNGFTGVTNAIMSQTNGIQSDLNALNIAAMQNQNALSTQLANCCCENRQGQADIKYQLATDTCAINTANANNTRDIIDAQNAGTRAILEAIQQGKIDALQDKIAALTAQNTQLSFAASQAAQNTYLVDTLRPCPVPAYVTCNPWGSQAPYGTCGCVA